MAITKQTVAIIHSDIQKALEEVAKKHNLQIGKTHITYSDTGFKFTGEFGDKDSIGDVNPTYFNDMKRHGYKFGLKTEDIGKEFTSGKNRYKIEGMKGYTFVVAKSLTNDSLYRFKGDVVQQLMGI